MPSEEPVIRIRAMLLRVSIMGESPGDRYLRRSLSGVDKSKSYSTCYEIDLLETDTSSQKSLLLM